MKSFTRLVFSVLSFAVLGHAQGFYWNTAGARSMAIGGIYVPSAAGPLEDLATNPAGLTNLPGRTADLSISAAFARGSFTNSTNTNSQMDTPPGAIPYGAFGMPIGKSRFSFAAGLLPAMMSVGDWKYNDAPGFAGANYGPQTEKSAMIGMRMVAGVGVYINQKLSIGATFGGAYMSNTLDAPDTFQSQPVVKGLKTLLNLKTSGFGLNASFGALIRPSRTVQISLAWKSPTVINSTGTATGNLGVQAAALGVPAVPTFKFDAGLHNVIPQSVIAGVSWRANPRWTFALQGDWIGWKTAFKNLPLALTNGDNPSINGLVGSTSLDDTIPFQWKDQYVVHAGFERLLTEAVSISGGYSHANDPVPSSTLSPLTAGIMQNTFSTGLGYVRGRSRFDVAYAFDPTAKGTVGQSGLLSGEYNNSTVRLGVQVVTLSMSTRF